MATKIALVATLGITAAAVLSVFRRNEIDERETAAFLLLFSVLFLFRVIGQILVAIRGPSWLPPMHQWHLMPYRLLLPIQLLFLGVMASIVAGLASGWEPVTRTNVTLGRTLIGFSVLYAVIMAVRYVVRMYRRPGERWFGGAIPIVFHFVLAGFLFTFGRYHVSG
jgi:hypothetical protein